MISEYENYAVQAMLGYYNHDYEMFFRYLDEGVIWYGPKEGQYIVGKDNLIAQVKKYESKIIFQVDSVESKLVSFSSNVISFHVSSIELLFLQLYILYTSYECHANVQLNSASLERLTHK